MYHEKLPLSLFTPVVSLSELAEPYQPIGRYGQLYQEHLEKYHKKLYRHYLLAGQLWTLSAEIEEQAVMMKKRLVRQLVAKYSNSTLSQIELDSINDAAEKIVLTELVYA